MIIATVVTIIINIPAIVIIIIVCIRFSTTCLSLSDNFIKIPLVCAEISDHRVNWMMCKHVCA